MVVLFTNRGDPDQMLHAASSDLGQHCLPVTHLGFSSLKRVKPVLGVGGGGGGGVGGGDAYVAL